MEQSPSIRLLLSGIARVAYTIAVIVFVGVIIDRLLVLPAWVEGPWRLLGFLPLLLGVTLEAAGTYAFWKYGRGTPHPAGHPNQLVTKGPYSWSRHPLYLARHLVLLGAAWLLGSPSVLVLTFLLFLVVQFVMIPREERRLSGRFAESYEEYRRRVSKWGSLRRRSGK